MMQNNYYNTFGSSIFSDSDSGCAVEEYIWVPPGLSPDQIRRYFSVIPEDKVPYPKSEGERYRIKQLTFQLPPQDCEPRFCRSLSESEVQELLAFKSKRKSESLGRGLVKELTEEAAEQLCCEKCNEQFEPYQLAVFASRAGHNRAWHPQCFTCTECSNLLIDLVYFYCNLDGRLYCGRHHAERFKPRCGACDELIFSDECTEAEGYTWHLQHFVCFSCEQPLASQRYLLQAQRPFCMRCYHETQTEICVACQQRIGVDDPQVTINGLFWHKSPSCYACNFCGKLAATLPGPPVVAGLELFCSPLCQSESGEHELNKENLEALLATSVTSPFAAEPPIAIRPNVAIHGVDTAMSYNNSDLLDPHSESFCTHNLPSHRQCPYHPAASFTSEPVQELLESAASGSVRGRPPISTISSQCSNPETSRRVHFPRSVSFPAEIDAQDDEETGRRKPRRTRRHHRHHRRRNNVDMDDSCSTCSTSSTDSVEETGITTSFMATSQGFSIPSGHNQILMSGQAGFSSNADVLSVSSSTGSGGTSQGRGLYAGKHSMSYRGRKKRAGSKNCLVS